MINFIFVINTLLLMTQEDVSALNKNIDNFLMIKIFIIVLMINVATI